MNSIKTNRKQKTKQYSNESIGESIRGIAGGVGRQTADLGKQMLTLDNWDEYLGITDSKEKKKRRASGDLTEGEELNLKDLKEKSEQKAEIEPGIDYRREIIHAGERAARGGDRELETQLREIAIEIKKIADSSKELQTQFKDVAIDQHVVKPGKYHKSFFTWILSMIRIARRKIEDSGAWLTALQSKKKQRQYGAMAKKYNTSFTLNNERVVATQVG